MLAARKKTEGCSFEDYSAKLASDREQIERKIVRNMELLRAGLFPLLDNLPEAGETELAGLHAQVVPADPQPVKFPDHTILVLLKPGQT